MKTLEKDVSDVPKKKAVSENSLVLMQYSNS
jgi:hypothetical protein